MEKHKKRLKITVFILLSVFLMASITLNTYFLFFSSNNKSYLQSTDQIQVMEAGILKNNLKFKEGENLAFSYDFDNEEYEKLKEQYDIEQLAGEGSEFQRALNLMNEFAPRLRHKSNYDNHIDMNALSLLSYSLDNKSHGINCRSKAQILNEMCLALGIYARKVWIHPYSGYDQDCHVVNEVWDKTLSKWVMLDITNNQYWVDDEKTPLSVLQIRQKGALREFCTPVEYGDNTENLEKLQEKHIDTFLYIMKNMVHMEWCSRYTVGETNTYLLLPTTYSTDYKDIISENACMASPLEEAYR